MINSHWKFNSFTRLYTYSRAYHYNPHCRGLKQCTTELEKLTLREAKEIGRKLCGYED
ncbi:hypothetical protein HMPREF1551_01467 [Capnocytophaga sp. oral taxon 863 str. F0517]|nr:hypothetical protein HMPREF1551_01467 [Capnocytophaga sp. oral taxon 863 str. F0517]